MEQETLQEAAENFALDKQNENTSKYYIALESFQKGAKWQMERSYSEEEVYNMIIDLLKRKQVGQIINYGEIEEWFKQFKKK